MKHRPIVNMEVKPIDTRRTAAESESESTAETSAVEKMVRRGTETLRHVLLRAGAERLSRLEVTINEFQYLIRAAEIALDSGKASSDPTEKKLNEARLRGVKRVAELRKAAEPVLETGQVCELLGVSRETIRKKVDARKLLALPKGADRVFPAFQFKEGAVIAGFSEALSVLDTRSPFTAVSFFLSKSSELGGKSALELLQAGETEPVVEEARTFLKHGA